MEISIFTLTNNLGTYYYNREMSDLQTIWKVFKIKIQ